MLNPTTFRMLNDSALINYNSTLTLSFPVRFLPLTGNARLYTDRQVPTELNRTPFPVACDEPLRHSKRKSELASRLTFGTNLRDILDLSG